MSDNVESVFALEFGFDGYFYDVPEATTSAHTPMDSLWLMLHSCLHEAKSGNRAPLNELTPHLSEHPEDDMFQISAVELMADAADDSVLNLWRNIVDEDEGPELTFDLCYGLLRRGLLRDVPLVVQAYRRNRTHPSYYYVQNLLNAIFAFEPVTFDPEPSLSVDACCEEVMKRYESLRSKFGTDDLPIFRSEIRSVQGIANEIIENKHGPEITHEMRWLFEAATGIDCTNWRIKGSSSFEAKPATEAAQRFLNSEEAALFKPGQLYFFGHSID